MDVEGWCSNSRDAPEVLSSSSEGRTLDIMAKIERRQFHSRDVSLKRVKTGVWLMIEVDVDG